MYHANSCKKAMLLLTCLILFNSCNAFIRSPLEILSWTPGKDVSTPTETTEITLCFNREPEPVCTEGAFSITAEGIEPPGRINIDGSVLKFTPYYSLEDNTNYEIKLSTAAEDEQGNSLTEDFHAEFRIGASGARPCIVSTIPTDGENIIDLQKPVVVVFDRAIDFDSILTAFSISPAISGVCLLDSEQMNFTFTPSGKWEWQQEYTIDISTDLKSINGDTIADNYSFGFTAGLDQVPPRINDASSEDGSITLTESPQQSAAIQVNTGWNTNTGLRFSFSEEVDQKSAESSVVIEPDINFTVEFDTLPTPSEMVISFDDNMIWHELYKISVSSALKDLQHNSLEEDHIYYLYIDGPASLPPSINRVELAEGGSSGFRIYDADNPASTVASHIILDTSGGDITSTPYFIDYYFTLARGAELPFFGFIENFLINPDDSCVSISYLDFQIYNPGDSVAAAAPPLPTPDANQAVVRLITSLTDNSGQSGQILLQVFSDLSDSFGNLMTEDWTVELFDEDS